MKDRIKGALARINKKMAAACSRVGRKREDVTLLAISKYHPVQAIESAAECGQKAFGENYLQEAEEKRKLLATEGRGQDLQWHFTGHLQTRKAKTAAGAFRLIHTLDSAKLAMALQKGLFEKGLFQDVLIEVNIGREQQKSGSDPEGVLPLADMLQRDCPNLNLLGLMCIPPFQSPERRPYFAMLRELNEKLRQASGLPLPHLSMGMSDDFETAIEEGATIVRIGTAIFGPRPLRPKKPE